MTPFVDLSDPAATRPLGGKADSLRRLLAAGFPVPDGFVVPAGALLDVLVGSGRLGAVEAALASLTKDSLVAVAADLAAAAAALAWPPELLAALAARVEPGVRYAVRSSAGDEDGSALSFAGQFHTLLDVAADDVPEAVLACYRSQFLDNVLHYHLDHRVPVGPSSMNVIVQRLVPAEVSGVAFTVNPITGHDTEVVIEAAPGLGDALVSGRVRPVRYVRDWFVRETDTLAVTPAADEDPLLPPEVVSELVELAVRVQRHYGFPCDIEWARAEGVVWLLQARPITRLGNAGIPDQWTTADFKDGGVSSTVCYPFMWSLYEYIWEDWLPRYLLESRLLEAADLRKLGDMFYGRPYWNLTVVKQAMAVAPGYKERAFDAELGVRITYTGDGAVTPITPATLLRVGRVALAQRRLVAERRRTATPLRDGLLATYERRLAELGVAADPAGVKRLWRRIVVEDYYHAEGTYFWQIFINTVHLALAREAIVKVVGHDGYFDLIGGLDDISHLRPYYDAWELSRQLRADAEANAWWTTTPVDQITAALDRGETRFGLDQVASLVERYGYHSVKELDLTHPDFDTDHASVVQLVLDTLGLGDDQGPHADRHGLQARYTAALGRARHALVRRVAGRELGRGRYRSFVEKVTKTRALLWWREEFRDCSTRHYHLIRLATLALADVLVAEGTLERADDVWFARAFDLVGLLDGTLDAATLRGIVARHRGYYDSFRHFQPANELGRVFDNPGEELPITPGAIAGIGGNSGSVTGVARVVSGLEDIGRLNPGEILVTTFTDTGWTSKFAMISGIVTEYGGILCHAAIVSREYGIPCVVAAVGCTTRIPDGALIRVDGSSGQVVILDEEG